MISVKTGLVQKSNPTLWGVHVAFWIVIFSLSVYFSALSFKGMYLFQRSLVLISGNIFVFYATYSWVVPKFLLKKRFLKAFLLIFIFIVLVTITRLYGDIYLMNKFNRAPEFDITKVQRVALMLFGELVFCGFAVLLRITLHLFESKKQIDELERLQLTTELLFLKSQMSPHFLFNSINNIYSLVLLQSEKAPEALMKMSELLRYSLYDCHNRVTLQQEIEAIKSYVDLFKLKFEDEVDILFNVQIEHTNYLIEPLLYIPIIENAFKYSGIGIHPQAFIKIIFLETDNSVILTVLNSKGQQNKIQESSGIGLVNIRKRLEKIYTDKHKLIIVDSEYTFETTLKLILYDS